MMNRRTFMSAIGVVALSSASFFPMTAHAAAAVRGEGRRPVRIVVPYTAGGPLDVSARAVADAVVKSLGTVVVENRPGAGGNIGMSYAARRPADGYTLAMGAVATLAINPHLFAKLPYDAKKDFRPVTLVATCPNVLVVAKEFSEKNNIRTVGDLVAYAKAHPGELNYASGGNGSAGHMCGELLKKRTGITMTHVPFSGASPALLSVLSGQTQLIFDNLASCSANIKAGKLVALAVTTKDRSPLLPEAKTMVEEGVPDFDIYTWYGLVAPGDTPPEVVEQLSAAIRPALEDSAMVQRFRGFGAVAQPTTPAEFEAMIAAEYDKYKELVALSGARVG